jgi:hypothetical protein
MRRSTFVLMVGLVLLPTVLSAQSKRHTTRKPTQIIQIKRGDCCWRNRWSLEPYAGAFKDAFDISADDENTGLLVGGRVGYSLGARTRLLANVGYTETDNVANSGGLSNYFVYDNKWVFTTAGGEFDVVPGRTSASLGLQGGAAWRRIDLDGAVGSPLGNPEADRGFHGQAIVVPSLLGRHRLSSRMTITAGLHDYISLDGPAQHSLALTAGVAFR